MISVLDTVWAGRAVRQVYKSTFGNGNDLFILAYGNVLCLNSYSFSFNPSSAVGTPTCGLST